MENIFKNHFNKKYIKGLSQSQESSSHTLLRKSVFSPLEKPSRSESFPALLSQSQESSSHTLLRKSGFSLAETMIALVIVSLVLAASAPLIAKKVISDSKKFLYTKDGNIFAAVANRQHLNVGTPDDDKGIGKFNVNGNTTINGELIIKPAADSNSKMILSGNGITVTDANNKKIIDIKKNTTTNIYEANVKIAIPDYSNMSSGTYGSTIKTTEDGFVYASNTLKGFKINPTDCSDSSPNPSGTSTDSLNFQIQTGIIIGSSPEITAISTLPMLVPISKGQCYVCYNNAPVINPNKNINNASAPNYCYFIPLKKTVRISVVNNE